MRDGGGGAGMGALIGGVLILVAMLVIGTLMAKMVFGPSNPSGATTSAPASQSAHVDHGRDAAKSGRCRPDRRRCLGGSRAHAVHGRYARAREARRRAAPDGPR